jgi:hypothetical protein
MQLAVGGLSIDHRCPQMDGCALPAERDRANFGKARAPEILKSETP